MRPQELENRLIDFAVAVVGVVELWPSTKAGNPIAGQLIRSGTSPAPNYREARSAESRRDFIHKMKISLQRTASDEKVSVSMRRRKKLPVA